MRAVLTFKSESPLLFMQVNENVTISVSACIYALVFVILSKAF